MVKKQQMCSWYEVGKTRNFPRFREVGMYVYTSTEGFKELKHNMCT